MTTIILPAFNEALNIKKVLEEIPEKYDVLVVDDGSTDNTSLVTKSLGFNCLRLDKNYGKGYACRKGVEVTNDENIIFMDSDSQFHPEDIEKLESCLENSHLVVGQRDYSKIPFFRKITNKLSLLALRKMVGLRLRDCLCGFRAVRRKDFLDMDLKENGYEFEIEMLLKAVERGFSINAVPVRVSYSFFGQGMAFRDSMRVVKFIVKNI